MDKRGNILHIAGIFRFAWLLGCLWMVLAPPVARAEVNPDPEVARVYTRSIHASELVKSKPVRDRWRDVLGEELGALQERHYLRVKLRRLIIGTLLDTFRKEQGIAVSREEIQAFRAARQAILERRLAAIEAEQLELESRLADAGLTPPQKAEVTVRLTSVRQMADGFRNYLARLERQPETVGDKGVASATILDWKVSKALYERYGGKVFCSGNAGLETPGALKALIEERLATYGISLIDPDYQDLFDDFQPVVSRDAFPVSRRLAEDYFREPWWIASHFREDPAAVSGAGATPQSAR